MSYKVSNVNLTDINIYLNSLNKTLEKNSLRKEKIKRIDHYNWWFENLKLKKYCLIKNQKKIIYFWIKKILKNRKKFFFSGWWPIHNELEIADYIYLTKLLIDFSKNCTHVAIISKKNKFSIKLHQYFKFEKVKQNSRLYSLISKLYYKEKKININHLIMVREN